MRLPVIKQIVEFISENDEDWAIETMELLEHIADAKGIKDEELEVIGELISNISGAIDVSQDIKSGTTQKDALNKFMKRVTGSID
jgi:predicted house-cleaning noncanonical NTP pyrophosphatase (MazG superfamily)